jgi:hypothetical protein
VENPILTKISEIMASTGTPVWWADHANTKGRAHTCLEPPQVSSCHSEFVAPFSVAHVRGKSVIQSIAWVTKNHRLIRTQEQQDMAAELFLFFFFFLGGTEI